MRLISATGSGVVATWSDAAVEEAFRTIPWVEEDLRAAADRVQTLVGITIGPLGERLDVSIREQILGRLTMRPLLPGEIVVKAGDPVPGLLLVGVGELELVQGDTVSGVVGSGDFLFPTEVLGAGAAPVTARAGAGGALVMFGDRLRRAGAARDVSAAPRGFRRDVEPSSGALPTIGLRVCVPISQRSSSLPSAPANRRPNHRASPGIVARPSGVVVGT